MNKNLYTNKLSLDSNSSKTTDQKRNFCNTTLVRADSRKSSVDSLTTSSYNGSDPGELRERADFLEWVVDDHKNTKETLKKLKHIEYKSDRGEPLSREEVNQLQTVKTASMQNYDDNKSVSLNISKEISKLDERISILDNRISAKRTIADGLDANNQGVNQSTPDSESRDANNQGVNQSSPYSKSRDDDLSPTKYVHLVESTFPLEIIPDDD